MTLDATTLRVAFAIAALTLLLLFLFVTFRTTRSSYSLWWCTALALFLAGSACYLLDATPAQVWANPLGNTLLVAGAGSVWAGARSLRRASQRWWQFGAAPLVTAVVSAFDSPATNVWAGGPVFLAAMAGMIALASRELFLLDPAYSRARYSLATASAVVAAFYTGRLVAFLVDGPDGEVFSAYFGTPTTTLLTMVLLVVVSFSMAGLSSEQVARDLTDRATRSSEEIAQAADVQRSLLPRTSPELPGYEIAGALVPSRGVSGDFFDWQPTRDGLALTVADVMGKGMGAAMIAATTRAAVRVTMPAEGPADGVATLDSVIAADLASTDSFVTMFHARLAADTGALSVVDAGHGLAVILREDGRKEHMPSKNLPLGVLPDQDWDVRPYQLDAGDLVLVFSDGVLDLFDGTLDSLARAADIAAAGVPTARGAVDSLTAWASSAELADDVTVVAIRRTA